MISSSFNRSKINTFNHTIRFLLNDKLIELKEGEFNPTDSLVSFLRSDKVNLKGTKCGCNEGGCGSCTVVMSSYDPVLKRIKHRPIDSCLMPLASLHNSSITTIEKLNEDPELNPIQDAFRRHNATQCGFCTPGFIMNMYAILLENPNPTNEDLEKHFDGNLCRCTGYRSILDALREFTKDYKPNDFSFATPPKSVRNPTPYIPTLKKLNFGLERPQQQSCVSISENNFSYYIPLNLHDLLNIKRENPQAKIIVGNTELLATSMPIKSYISAHLVDELKYIKQDQNAIRIGAATPIDDIYKYCEKSEDRILKALQQKFSLFASNQIRSIACMTGNIVAAGSSTDLTNFLPGVQASIKVIDTSSNNIDYKERIINLDNFFIGHNKTVLKDSDVITEIFFKPSKPTEHCFAYKSSIRREIDGVLLSATIRADINEGDNTIKDISIAYSKIRMVASRAKKTEAFLKGKKFTEENIKKAFEILDTEDFPFQSIQQEKDFIDDGFYQYRTDLTHEFLLKFFHQTERERGRPHDVSIAEAMTRPPPQLTLFHHQCIKDKKSTSKLNKTSTSKSFTNDQIVGKTVHNISSSSHVRGLSEFTDDIPLPPNTLHAAFVCSTIPYGKIKSIHYPKSAKLKAIIEAKDLPNPNLCVASTSEPLLSNGSITYNGQPIAIILSDNERDAWDLARMTQVEYDPYPPLLTVSQAISEHRTISGPKLTHGNPSSFFTNPHPDLHILNGTVDMGGQYHFYMEPVSCLAEIKSDGKLILHPTCKDLTTVNEEAAKFTSLRQSDIDVTVKQIGGAFCGKGIRATYVSSACAIAAQKLHRPIKMQLPRNVDVHLMSGDHNFTVFYRVAFDSTGRIHALEMDFYVDAGYSYSSSNGIGLKAILHADSVYNIPNFSARVHLCPTNKISGAPFRGFGCQNGCLAVETVLENISRFLQAPPDIIKYINFYNDKNSTTPYGVVLNDTSNIYKCWELVKNHSKITELRKNCDEFNRHNHHKKRGLAITPVKFGVGFPSAERRRATVLIHLHRDGSIYASHSGIETGQGLHTKMAQLISQSLKAPFSMITIDKTDTQQNSFASCTGGSFANDLVGHAISDACNQLNSRLDRYRKNGKEWKTIVREAYNDRQNLSAHGFYISPQEKFNSQKMIGRPYQYYEYGASVSCVEIDTMTGENRVIESDIVFDAGQSMNPGIDIGQIEGGFIQGLGWMTMERPQSAKKPLTDSFFRYKIPALSCFPERFSIQLLPGSFNEVGVISAKGVGEPPAMLAMSVGMALYDAIDSARREKGFKMVHDFVFPLTVDRIHHLSNYEN